MIGKRTLIILFITIALFLSGAPSAVGKEVLHVYNWSDYMDEGPKGPVAVFEKRTGIDVTYDVFDSNEVLEAKLLAGKTGYDVVFPSNNFIGRQIKAGVFMKLDRSKLKNYKHLDKGILKVLESVDPGNEFSIPYMWGTTGIGYNVKKVQAAFGGKAPLDSWDLVFKPENAAKLKDCGLAMLDDPSEILSMALHYLGKDPNSMNSKDYTEAAQSMLMSIRPYVKYFHSSQYINDLANGDICAVIGWSGDILQARDRADEAGAGVEIAYSIPKEGAATWFDMIAIPADADNVDNAHKFMDFLMEPEVIAGITNYVSAYLSSLKTAAGATCLALLVGYPIAYGIARAHPGIRNLLVLGIVLPFWTSLLLRIYAWIGILKTNGLINNLLLKLGIIDTPLHLLHTDFSVYIGIVYAYLPFMVLPLYTNLVKLDESYLEAAADLGAKPWKTFLFVTLPLSKGGIIAGSMLVFIPAVGEFVIPALLGGPDTLMIGKVLWDEFFSNRDWPVASAVAIIMLLILIIPMMWFHKHQTQEMETA